MSHGSLDHRLEHLSSSTFLPGKLALRVFTLPDTELPPKRKEVRRLAAPWSCLHLRYFICGSGVGFRTVWKWLINGSWEVDKVMYHQEWENRYRTHQREIRIIPKWFLRPEVRRFYLFFRKLLLLIFFFFLGGGRVG